MTKDFLRSNFMVFCLGAAIVLIYPLLVFPKGELELLINRYHLPGLDFFFKYLTHLGDGSLMALLFISLLFYKYYFAILTAFSIVIQSVFISIFKRWIFNGLERPLAFFPESLDLNFIEGVDIHSTNTFPSGHTATGFALFALLFLIIDNHSIIVSLLLFTLAFLVGFSRVYLLQHFVVDAYFGALFGLLSVIGSLYFMHIIFNRDRLEFFMHNSLKIRPGNKNR